MKLQDFAHWAEIVASFAVVVSLIFLTLEVRENTIAIESQAIRDRSNALNSSFARSPKIPEILAKIKTVDGPEPLEHAYMDRYGLTYEEASIWGRYVAQLWNDMEADFTLNGPSDRIADRIQLFLLAFPDEQIYWSGLQVQSSNDAFLNYVDEVLDRPVVPMVEEYRARLNALKEETSSDPGR